MPCSVKRPFSTRIRHLLQVRRPPQVLSILTPNCRAASRTGVPALIRPRRPEGMKMIRRDLDESLSVTNQEGSGLPSLSCNLLSYNGFVPSNPQQVHYSTKHFELIHPQFGWKLHCRNGTKNILVSIQPIFLLMMRPCSHQAQIHRHQSCWRIHL